MAIGWQGRAIWPMEGTEDGGRHLELELKGSSLSKSTGPGRSNAGAEESEQAPEQELCQCSDLEAGPQPELKVFRARSLGMGGMKGIQERGKEVYKRSGAAVVEAKQRIQLQKQTHHIFSSSLSHTNTPPTPLSLPPSRHPPRAPDPKTQTMSSISSFTHSQSSNGSQASDPSAQQQRHPRTRLRPRVPPDARRQPGNPAQHPGHNPRLARWNDRLERTVCHERPEHTRCRHQRRTPSPHSRFKAQRRPGPATTASTQGMTTTSTGSIAKLPGNDPMLFSIQEIFPALDTAVVQSIYTNKFQATNLPKLKASFI